MSWKCNELYVADRSLLLTCWISQMEEPIFYFWFAHYHFRDIKMRTWKLVSQQYTAWSDGEYVQTGLALQLWQMLITFGSTRIRKSSVYIRKVEMKLLYALQISFICEWYRIKINTLKYREFTVHFGHSESYLVL